MKGFIGYGGLGWALAGDAYAHLFTVQHGGVAVLSCCRRFTLTGRMPQQGIPSERTRFRPRMAIFLLEGFKT